MKNPPKRKLSQTDFVNSAVRLPPDLHAELKAAAEINGRSLNAEMIARLRYRPSEELLREISEIKALLRASLDQR
jgi:predicted HicB family RNase H-like nuclease